MRFFQLPIGQSFSTLSVDVGGFERCRSFVKVMEFGAVEGLEVLYFNAICPVFIDSACVLSDSTIQPETLPSSLCN